MTTIAQPPQGIAPADAIRRSRTAVVVSEDPEARHGWARALESSGFEVVRCAGPTVTCVLLRGGDRCPLLDQAAFALYDERLLSGGFAERLARSCSEAILIATRDRCRLNGDHEPAMSRVVPRTEA